MVVARGGATASPPLLWSLLPQPFHQVRHILKTVSHPPILESTRARLRTGIRRSVFGDRAERVGLW